MVENWEQYKDLEYYPDRFCKCGCGGRIKVKFHHKYSGIPEFIHGHHVGYQRKGKLLIPRELRMCVAPDCNITFECKVMSERKYCCNKHRRVGIKHSEKTIEKMRGPRIPRETRICACGCGGAFECKVKSKQKYVKGHHGRNKLPREIRICSYSGCDNTFECKIGSDRNHCTRECYWKDMKGQPSLKKNKTYEECYGEEKAKEIKQKLREANLGENSPNWRGGPAPGDYPLEFNKEFKNLIRERDNNTCQLCGRTKEEEYRNLCVHHIYYDKENSDMNLERFVTLCNSCNIKVNYNRDYWKEFFNQRILVLV